MHAHGPGLTSWTGSTFVGCHRLYPRNREALIMAEILQGLRRFGLGSLLGDHVALGHGSHRCSPGQLQV
jgi:hypothetical protein